MVGIKPPDTQCLHVYNTESFSSCECVVGGGNDFATESLCKSILTKNI